jgi:hypothetical protein
MSIFKRGRVRKNVHISRFGTKINSFVRLMPSHFAIKIGDPSSTFNNLNLYGFSLTVSLAVKTGGTFIGVKHHRPIIKPFENTISERPNTHLTSCATIVIDLDS